MRLRYKQSEILVIIGLIISSFVCFYFADVVERLIKSGFSVKPYASELRYGIQHEDIVIEEISGESENRYEELVYTYSSLSPVSLADIAEISSEMDNCDVEISFLMQVGHAGCTLPVTVFFQKPKDFSLKVRMKGGAEKQPTVYIGKTIRQYTVETGDKTSLWLDEMAVSVGGVLECKNLAEYDETILVDYSTCNEGDVKKLEWAFNNTLTSLWTVKVYFRFMSIPDEADIRQIENRFAGEKMLLRSEALDTINDDINQSQTRLEIVFVSFMFFFALANLLCVCSLWFLERTHEFRVRRLCGARAKDIFSRIGRDFVRLAFIAQLVAVLVMAGVELVVHGTGSVVYKIVTFEAVFLVALLISLVILAVRFSLFWKNEHIDKEQK